jgi:hypothetical protein
MKVSSASTIPPAPPSFSILGDFESPRHLRAANAILAVDQHPECRHPLIHAERGILENRPHLDAELLLASLTEPHQAGAQKRVLLVTATWTGNLLSRPAKVDGIDESVLGISEVGYSFLQGLGLFNVRHFFALSLYLMRE